MMGSDWIEQCATQMQYLGYIEANSVWGYIKTINYMKVSTTIYPKFHSATAIYNGLSRSHRFIASGTDQVEWSATCRHWLWVADTCSHCCSETRPTDAQLPPGTLCLNICWAIVLSWTKWVCVCIFVKIIDNVDTVDLWLLVGIQRIGTELDVWIFVSRYYNAEPSIKIWDDTELSVIIHTNNKTIVWLLSF